MSTSGNPVDPNLLAANIVDGASIYGVDGSAVEEPTSYASSGTINTYITYQKRGDLYIFGTGKNSNYSSIRMGSDSATLAQIAVELGKTSYSQVFKTQGVSEGHNLSMVYSGAWSLPGQSYSLDYLVSARFI